MSNLCPCGSAQSYAECCGLYISGSAIPTTAETLMRSRYVAFVNVNERYLLDTWHASTQPEQLGLDKSSAKWFDLKIEKVEQGGEQDTEGSVEFTAKFKVQGKADHLHEVSQFTKVAGRWYYVGGIIS